MCFPDRHSAFTPYEISSEMLLIKLALLDPNEQKREKWGDEQKKVCFLNMFRLSGVHIIKLLQ